MFQRQKISSSPFSICFLKIYKNPSDNCYIFSGAHKSKQHQVHYSWIIKQISQCRNFRKTNVVERDQENLFFDISFLVHISYPLIFFLVLISSTVVTCQSVFFKFGHWQSLYPQKFLILLIRKSKRPQQNEENEVSLSNLNVKMIKYYFLIRLEENETTSFFQKSRNYHNMG